MEDNAKCFIKTSKGDFEEITYKELKDRKKIKKEYLNKWFIPVQRDANGSDKKRICRFL